MKKILVLLLILVSIPCLVNAKTYCEVVSGTGKEIGDEIKCGTESFYVLGTERNVVSLLAKYNLFVGDKIDYFDLDEPKEYSSDVKEDELNKVCNKLADEKGYKPYYVYAKREQVDKTKIKMLGCRVYERINEEYVRQDSRAVGTKLVDGKSVLPLYGITYMVPSWGYEAVHDGKKFDNEYDENGNLIVKESPFQAYLDDYRKELNRQEIDVNGVSFITLNGALDLLEKISGKKIDVKLEYPNLEQPLKEPLENPEDAYVGKMDVKKYAKDNDWLFDSTYWLGSGFKQNSLGEYYDYYMSNEGFLCAIGRGECLYLPYPIGNGVRPLVTIRKDSVVYPGQRKERTIKSFVAIVICAGIAWLFLVKSKSEPKKSKK